MATGNFEQTPNPEIARHAQDTPIKLGMTATSVISKGDEIVISGNLSVAKRTLATQTVIGFAQEGAIIGEKALVFLQARSTLIGKAAVALTAGQPVVQNGTAVNADGTNNYIVATSGQRASGLVAENAIVGQNVLIILQPVIVP